MTTTKVLSANELANRFYLAITSRDRPALAQVLADDATWTFPGNNLLSGTATGIEQIVAKADLIGSYGVHVGFEYVMVGASSFIIKLHNTGRRADLDLDLDEHLGTVCTARDGRIVSADTHLSDIALMDRFFAPLPAK